MHNALSPQTDSPPIFHVTHWKAGSQWVAAVMRRILRGRPAFNRIDQQSLPNTTIQPGALFSPAYLTRECLLDVAGESPSRFIVIRDLRDTLVSWYFSILYSHLNNPVIEARRARVAELDREQGMLLVFEESLSAAARIQQSWIGHSELVVRYEDLIADQFESFRCICAHLGLDVGPNRLRQIIANCSFEQRSGRRPGEEDQRSHLRKGIAGDWRNHFTPRLIEMFKDRYGQLLIDTGYERSRDWHTEPVG